MREHSQEFSESIYMIADTLDTSAGIWPLRIGRNIAKSHYRSGPKRILHYNVHLVIKGKVQFTYDDQTLILEEGDLFCMFPNQLYMYGAYPDDEPLQMTWFVFDGTLAAPLLAMTGLAEATPVLHRPPDQQLQTIFIQMLENARTVDIKHKMRLHALLYQWFAHLIPNGNALSAAQSGDHWVQQGIDMMKAHYMERLTIQALTRQIGVNRSHFTRVFTQTVGIPPIQYLQNLRLEKSAELLRHSALSVTEIALSTGYADLYSFTRAFSKRYRISPSEYRRSN